MKILMVLTSHDQLGNTGRKIGSDTTWARSQARPAPDAILNSGTLRMGRVRSQAWRIRFECLY